MWVPRPVFAWASHFLLKKLPQRLKTKRKSQKNVLFSDQATKASLTPLPPPDRVPLTFLSDFPIRLSYKPGKVWLLLETTTTT